MNLKFRDQVAYRGSVDQVDTSPLYEVGTVAKTLDTDSASNYGEVEVIYLKNGTAVAEDVGSVITFGGDYETALAVANAVGNIAVSINAKTGDKYGWYAVKGNIPAKVLASFADNAKCYLTATAGSLDDAPVAGDDVFAAKSITAIGTPAAGLAVINLNHSFVMDGLAV